LIVGYCEDFVPITNQTNCVAKSFVQSNLQYLATQSNIVSHFLDEKQYGRSQTLNYTFQNDVTGLNPAQINYKNYILEQNNVVFKNHAVINGIKNEHF